VALITSYFTNSNRLGDGDPFGDKGTPAGFFKVVLRMHGTR